MDFEPLVFLKSHAEQIRAFIESRFKETYPRDIALGLFDLWKKALDNGGLVEDHEGAFVSSGPLTLGQFTEALKTLNVHRQNVKPHITRARDALQARPLAVDGQLLSLDICKRRYSFKIQISPDPAATLKLIWAPYLNEDPVVVASVKRLFFRVNKDVYIRNITVDNDSCWDQCGVLKQLFDKGQGPPHAVRLYAPSGEISAAFALLDVFNNKLDLQARGTLIAPHYKHVGQNLVVLGSGIEEPHFTPPAQFGFCYENFEDGVRDLKSGRTFSDKLKDPHLTVYITVQRWRKDDGKVMSVIYGSHGAAIEFVVQALVSEPEAAALLAHHPPMRRNWLRKRTEFECLFAVELDRDGTYYKLRNIAAIPPTLNRVKAAEIRRKRYRLKKGA